MGCVNDVLKDLITSIKESGILNKCDSVNLIINGDINGLNIERIPKLNIIDSGMPTTVCEFSTLKKIWEDSNNIISRNGDANILYLHTKGISRTSESIKDWTRLMTYFNVTKWEDRISELKYNDCTGINLSGYSRDLETDPIHWGYTKFPLHYSGNFWWTKASHVVRLKDPMEWAPDKDYLKWKMMCEMWICSSEGGNYHNAYHSNTNHYHQRYPKELYEN